MVPFNTMPRMNVNTIAVAKLRRLNRRTFTIGIRMLPFPVNPEADGHDRKDQQAGDPVRGEPVFFLALIEHDLQRANAQRNQREADVIDFSPPPLRLRSCSCFEIRRIFDEPVG